MAPNTKSLSSSCSKHVFFRIFFIVISMKQQKARKPLYTHTHTYSIHRNNSYCLPRRRKTFFQFFFLIFIFLQNSKCIRVGGLFLFVCECVCSDSYIRLFFPFFFIKFLFFGFFLTLFLEIVVVCSLCLQ